MSAFAVLEFAWVENTAGYATRFKHASMAVDRLPGKACWVEDP